MGKEVPMKRITEIWLKLRQVGRSAWRLGAARGGSSTLSAVIGRGERVGKVTISFRVH